MGDRVIGIIVGLVWGLLLGSAIEAWMARRRAHEHETDTELLFLSEKVRQLESDIANRAEPAKTDG